MSLKRRTGSVNTFSMASMTDVIFLLLIFFMITSTFVLPNAIKVALPSAERQPPTENEMLRLTVTSDLQYYAAYGKAAEQPVAFDAIHDYLAMMSAAHPNLCLAIYADESVPYREVVRLINRAAGLPLNLMLATKIVHEPAGSFAAAPSIAP